METLRSYKYFKYTNSVSVTFCEVTTYSRECCEDRYLYLWDSDKFKNESAAYCIRYFTFDKGKNVLYNCDEHKCDIGDTILLTEQEYLDFIEPFEEINKIYWERIKTVISEYFKNKQKLMNSLNKKLIEDLEKN